MANLTKMQQMMVEDGLPADLVIPQAERNAAWKGVRLTKPLASAQAAPEDPGTVQLRKELEAKARAEAKKRKADRKEAAIIRARQKAALKTPQETDMTTKTAKKSKTAKRAPAKKVPAKPAAKPPAAPKKAKAPEAPAAGTRPDGLREGSMQAKMLDMVLASTGATEKEICEELGWKKCRTTLNRVAEKVGATLAKSKEEGRDGTVYRATLPAKKAA